MYIDTVNIYIISIQIKCQQVPSPCLKHLISAFNLYQSKFKQQIVSTLQVLVCSRRLLQLLWMINVQIGERYPGHDTLSLRLRRCCMLAVYLYAARAAAHSLSPTWAREHSASKPYLKYEDLSWTGHNAENFLLSFHMLHTHKPQSAQCLFSPFPIINIV